MSKNAEETAALGAYSQPGSSLHHTAICPRSKHTRKAPRARGPFRNLTTPRLTKSNTTYFFTRRMKPSSSPVFRGVSALRFWTCRPASVIAPPRSGLGAFGVRVMKPAWGFSS